MQPPHQPPIDVKKDTSADASPDAAAELTAVRPRTARTILLDPSWPSLTSVFRVVVLAMVLIFAGVYLRDILTALSYFFFLLVIAVFIAYLLAPLVNLIRRPFAGKRFDRLMPRPLAILLSLLVATLVRADDTAPPPEGGAQVMRSRLVNNMVEMIDTRDGAIVVSPQSMPLHVPTPSSAGVAPSIELREQPTGFDLIYTFANTSGTTRALGKLQLGVVNLGQNIRFRDFTKSGAERSAAGDNRAFGRSCAPDKG